MLIRPYRKGLVLHTMYYGDEVRDFNEVPKGEKVKVSEKELELGVGLIDRLTSEEFIPENYKDEYRIRVLGMIDEEAKGKEIVTGAAPAVAGFFFPGTRSMLRFSASIVSIT